MSGGAENPVPAQRAIWITRPERDAQELAHRLKQAGLDDILVEPLIGIAFETGPVLPGNIAAWAFTSANGVRAVARLTAERSVPAWVIGPATARAAEEEGFAVAGVAGSDVESLAALIAETPPAGKVCHATGSHRAGNLVAALAGAGIGAEALQLYEAVAAEQIPPLAEEGLRRGMIGAVALYSPRTAAIFRRLIEQAGLQASLDGIRLLCLSPAVAEPLQGLPSGEIMIASEPSTGAMIDIAVTGLK